MLRRYLDKDKNTGLYYYSVKTISNDYIFIQTFDKSLIDSFDIVIMNYENDI